jgi:hypothetical protein
LSTGIGKNSFKVLFRRGKAKVIRGDFKGGRIDLERCRDVCGELGAERGEKEAREVEREIKKVRGKGASIVETTHKTNTTQRAI